MIATEIYVGNKCNLNCVFCVEKNIQFVSTENILKHIEEIRKISSTITITGGEPTIRSDFFDILDRCLSIFKNTIILSNLKIMLDEKFYNEFIKRDHSKISIQTSLDSHIKEINNESCGSDFYSQKLDLIDRLYKFKYRNFIIGSVITNLNVVYLKDWCNFVVSRWPNANIFLKVYNPTMIDFNISKKLLPSYDYIYSILFEIIKYEKNINKFQIANLPLCMLINIEKFSMEYDLMKSVIGNIPGTHELRLMFPENVFHSKCEKCIHYGYCTGINKAYFFIYGDEFLEPVLDQSLTLEVRK